MATNPQTLVHVGFMKSGSTSLQDNVFSRHSGIRNIWKPDPGALLRQMINVEDNELDLAAIDDLLASNRSKADQEKKVLVLSNEVLTSTPALWPAAHRIKRFLPDSKIFLCIREQKAIIESYYLYNFRHLAAVFGVPEKYHGLPVSFDEFFQIHFPEGDQQDKQTLRHTRLWLRLRYMKTASLYREIFGPDNVLVLPIEMTRKDPGAFADRLEAFCGIDAAETVKLLGLKKKNIGTNRGEIAYERWRQYLPSSIPLSKIIPFGSRLRTLARSLANREGDQVIEWSDGKLNKIKSLYAAQNAELAEAFDLDLGKYGYMTS